MDPSIPLKLVLAAVLGGIIGIEREIRDKPTGLRANILICMGSTLFMSVSARVAELIGGDPTRITAQFVSGIGFLGAGAVLHSHGFVLGLTTAATIWIVAGVGVALGSGMYIVAFLVTAMTLATLYFLAFVEDKVQGRASYSYSMVVRDLNQALVSINRVLEDSSVAAASFNFRKKTGHYRVWFNLFIPRETNLKIIQRLSEIPEITNLEIGGGPKDSSEGGPGKAGDQDGHVA